MKSKKVEYASIMKYERVVCKKIVIDPNFRVVKDKSETYFHASNVSQSWSQT